MNPKVRKVYNFFDYHLSKLGNKVYCNICHKKSAHFMPFRGGYETMSDFQAHLNMVGGIRKTYGCVHCGSTDRERNLFLYFDKLNIWEAMKDATILHCTPERNVKKKIKELHPSTYIQGDIDPSIDPEFEKVDITQIQFDDNYFDVILCNHVLEHVMEYEKALAEIYRVLKPNGIAILQTPHSKFLHDTFYDPNIQTEEDRLYFYGLGDHVRVFSENDFLNAIKNTGFKMQIAKHKNYFTDKEIEQLGVNPEEDLIKVSK